MFLLAGAGAGTARAEPPAAAAEPPAAAAEANASYSFGARVGGYGFRNTQHPDRGEWDDCRMDGFGLFAQRALSRHLFAEAALDLYGARDATPTERMPEPAMDRISGITTVAGGARIPWRWVSPYVQLGVGLELTRVEMPGHSAERAALPVGFFGIGAELRPTPRIALGGNVRANLMAHYVHDHTSGASEREMSREYEAATQGQLFVRLEM
jgi:hypothetical protein